MTTHFTVTSTKSWTSQMMFVSFNSSTKGVTAKPFGAHPDLIGVRLARTLAFCVVFCRSMPFCPFSFGHCVVCSSSIYGLWLPIWYLQTLLMGPQLIEKWCNCLYLLMTTFVIGQLNYHFFVPLYKISPFLRVL